MNPADPKRTLVAQAGQKKGKERTGLSSARMRPLADIGLLIGRSVLSRSLKAS